VQVLSLAADFPLPVEGSSAAEDGGGGGGGGGSRAPQPEMSYVMTSTFAGRDVRRETRLGILPRRGGDRRTANIISWPDHAVFADPALATEPGMRAFLAESYPQMDWGRVCTHPPPPPSRPLCTRACARY